MGVKCCCTHLRAPMPLPFLSVLLGVTREPHWFPGHQPELEPPPIKPTARSCYMIDYEPPHGRAACALAEGKPKAAEETPLKQ